MTGAQAAVPRIEAGGVRDALPAGHPKLDACRVVEASPALGMHAGPGALVVGMQPREGIDD